MPRRRKQDSLVDLRELLGANDIRAGLERIAAAILERNTDHSKLVLLGIHTGGAVLARRLQRMIADTSKATIPLGTMDITLYRDDVFVGLPKPEVGPTLIPCSLDGRIVIVIDDVLFTGRTIRSALVELMDFGRPAQVQLAVLVDRGHRELPIQPDYVGVRVDTAREQSVRVMLSEIGEVDRVALYGKAKP